MARCLDVATPDLTGLAQENDGTLPLLDVIQGIDGRWGVGPHGTLMPVWAERFMAGGVKDAGPCAAEVIVRGRVLSLAAYFKAISGRTERRDPVASPRQACLACEPTLCQRTQHG